MGVNCFAKRGRVVGQANLRNYLSASSFASTFCQAVVRRLIERLDLRWSQAERESA